MIEVISSRHPHVIAMMNRFKFKLAADEVTLENPILSRPRNIIMAGASYNSSEGLSVRDQCWTMVTFSICRGLGFEPTQNFRLMPANIINGDDVLKPFPKLSADILIVANIIDPLSPNWNQEELRRRLEDEAEEGFNTSLLHTQSAWRETAMRIGARMIVTFGTYREISGRHFEGPEYETIIQTKYTPPVIIMDSGKPETEYSVDCVLRKDLVSGLAGRRKSKAAGNSIIL